MYDLFLEKSRSEGWPALVVLFLFVMVQLAAAPMSFWEYDEPLFAQALIRYEPRIHNPPPPGYPVFIAAGKVVNFFVKDGFQALRALSVISSIVGFLVLSKALAIAGGKRSIGVGAALLFYLSPAMLVHSTLPISDPVALALLGLALLWSIQCFAGPCSMATAACFAVAAALTVGCRPQYCLAILPLLAVTLMAMGRWRTRAVALGIFTVICLIWLIPVIEALGGVEPWYRWLSAQAEYFAGHDSDLSRGRSSLSEILIRFVAHPWGPKLLSVPLLMLAMVGAATMLRERRQLLLPMAAMGLPYLGFALWAMDPADAVRYALPAVLFFAFLAGVGANVVAGRRSAPAAAIAFLLIAGAVAYVSGFLVQRSTVPSPPMQAVRYVWKYMPPNGVIGHELALAPHAQNLLRPFHPRRIDEAWSALVDAGDIPFWIFADGGSEEPGAVMFRWEDSDAYGKLTRNHYRVVSLVPVPPSRRYRAGAGVYAPERSVRGESWRWLDREARIGLPRSHGQALSLRFSIPTDAPYPSNTITVSAGGVTLGTVVVPRGASSRAELSIPAAAREVTFQSRDTYVPARAIGNRDTRRVAVKLTDFELRAAHAP